MVRPLPLPPDAVAIAGSDVQKVHVKDIATVVQGPKIRLGQIGKSCRFGATPISESDPTARPAPGRSGGHGRPG